MYLHEEIASGDVSRLPSDAVTARAVRDMGGTLLYTAVKTTLPMVEKIFTLGGMTREFLVKTGWRLFGAALMNKDLAIVKWLLATYRPSVLEMYQASAVYSAHTIAKHRPAFKWLASFPFPREEYLADATAKTRKHPSCWSSEQVREHCLGLHKDMFKHWRTAGVEIVYADEPGGEAGAEPAAEPAGEPAE